MRVEVEVEVKVLVKVEVEVEGMEVVLLEKEVVDWDLVEGIRGKVEGEEEVALVAHQLVCQVEMLEMEVC